VDGSQWVKWDMVLEWMLSNKEDWKGVHTKHKIEVGVIVYEPNKICHPLSKYIQ